MIVQDANVQNSNDFYFSSSKPQESKHQEQILHDEKTIEQMQHGVQSLCSDLLGKEYGQDFNSNMWLDSFLKYISRDDSRLFYSTISYFIFEIDDEKYADLSIHLSSILQEANQRFKDQKIDHQSYKAILKFYDHITLANQQKLMVDRRSQSLHKEIQQEIKEEVKSGILTANTAIISQLVGLVALFTAMSFLVFGGIASLDSIFKSVERFVNLESSVLPVLMVVVAWAFCMMNLLLCFMYFVLRLVKPEQFTIRVEQHIVQRYPIVFITNYILLILFAVFFAMWFAKCNGIGLPIFNFVVSHSVMTFWIGLLIIVAGLAILGIWLYCSYHSKSSPSAQHHAK